VVPREQYQSLHDALATVTVNAQALAAADLASGALVAVRDRFSVWSVDNARRFAASQLDDALADVQRFRGPFAGMPAAAINPSQWDDLSHAIERAYNVLWNIQDVIGDEPEWNAFLGWVADTTLGTIQALPGVLRAAVHFTADLATDTVGAVAAGLLPLWPIVAVVAVVVVLGAVALATGKKRGLVA
jgi:hypothetical protein